jgi:hypothetical protein
MQFQDDNNKDDRGVLLDNKMIFAKKLNENLLSKQIPQILAVTTEFQSVGAHNQTELDLMKKILRDNDEVKDSMPKAVSRNT